MIRIPFSDERRFTFSKYFVRTWKPPVTSRIEDATQTMHVSHEILAQMLRNLDQNGSSILYYYYNNRCYWLLLEADEEKLDKFYASLRPFLIPSYLGGDEAGGLIKRRLFSAGKGEMNGIGAELFPQGFYLFRSQEKDFETILESLGLWNQLRQRKPQRLRENRPSYFDLYQAFQDALREQCYVEAQEALEKIKRFSLSTAENIAFLRYILWGAQEEWKQIWSHPDFTDISKLSMPRPVRVMMLSAFYHEVLHPVEEHFGPREIMQAFDDHRARLGTLLNGRFGETRAEILRVFAYQSVREQNHELFEDILSVCDTNELINLLSTLESYFQQEIVPQLPTVEIVDERTPLEKARLAMMNADYDSALKAAFQVEAGIDQTFLLLQIAIHSGDLSVDMVECAFRAYEQLTLEQKQFLANQFPQSQRYLRFLENTVNEKTFPSTWDSTTALLRNRTWNAISDLEVRLRKEIRARYMAYFGNNWIVSIEANMIERWNDTKESDPFPDQHNVLLDYSFLSDLARLILRQWGLFTGSLGSSPEERNRIDQQFDVLIAVRNSLAHNRSVNEAALKEALEICRQLMAKILTEPG